jgi:hypothetical protein
MTRKVLATIKIKINDKDNRDCGKGCSFEDWSRNECRVFGQLNPDNARRHKNCLKAEVKK